MDYSIALILLGAAIALLVSYVLGVIVVLIGLAFLLANLSRRAGRW